MPDPPPPIFFATVAAIFALGGFVVMNVPPGRRRCPSSPNATPTPTPTSGNGRPQAAEGGAYLLSAPRRRARRGAARGPGRARHADGAGWPLRAQRSWWRRTLQSGHRFALRHRHSTPMRAGLLRLIGTPRSPCRQPRGDVARSQPRSGLAAPKEGFVRAAAHTAKRDNTFALDQSNLSQPSQRLRRRSQARHDRIGGRLLSARAARARPTGVVWRGVAGCGCGAIGRAVFREPLPRRVGAP